jgi:hypothetical protein
MEIRDGCVGWNPEVRLELPFGSTVLTVQAQDNLPVLWAEVDPETSLRETHHFFLLNTGAELPARSGKYLNTVQINGGKFIFHIYKERS